jgi:hypothetical protein
VSPAWTTRPAALEHAESRAIEQVCHEPRGTVEPLEQRAYFVTVEHDGHVLGPLGPHDAVEPGKIDLEHLAVQEQENDAIENGEQRTPFSVRKY